MARDDKDPFELQERHGRARARLRANIAAALLLDWLIIDVETLYPDYLSDLESRFQTGFDYAEMWRDDPKFDGFVPLHGRDGSTLRFLLHSDDFAAFIAPPFPPPPNTA